MEVVLRGEVDQFRQVLANVVVFRLYSELLQDQALSSLGEHLFDLFLHSFFDDHFSLLPLQFVILGVRLQFFLGGGSFVLARFSLLAEAAKHYNQMRGEELKAEAP